MSDLGTDRHPAAWGRRHDDVVPYDDRHGARHSEHHDDRDGGVAHLEQPPPPAAADVIDLSDGRHVLAEHYDLGTGETDTEVEALDPDSVEAILADAIDLVATARLAPMSSSVKVDRDELLDLLEAALEQLPNDLRDARWVLRDRDALIEDGRRERAALIDEGRLQVARMVERQEIVRAAERKARSIVEEARTEARSLQHKVEDYCDARLAEFEGFLDRTASTVRQSRQRLNGELPERRRTLEG